jgi:transposase-like protein
VATTSNLVMLEPQRRGRWTALKPTLTDEQRQTLESWQNRSSITALQARRARLVLLVAAGVPIRRASQSIGLSRNHCYEWLKRFAAEGVAGLK